LHGLKAPLIILGATQVLNLRRLLGSPRNGLKVLLVPEEVLELFEATEQPMAHQ